MEFIAKANFVRVSPQKARLVLDLIKGQRVEDALNTLLFTKKGIAPAIYKLVHSAMDNANYLSNEKGMDLDLDRLYVKKAIANDGPRMKRIRPAPMGRAFRYQRRISHIEIALAEKPSFLGSASVEGDETPVQAKPKGAKTKKAPAKKAAAKKAPAKKSAAKKTAAKK
jgi:large subunit ribosomal protein L22